jgi:Cu2+-containing amine oxidase
MGFQGSRRLASPPEARIPTGTGPAHRMTSATRGSQLTHPLDPLTAAEIRQAAAITRRERGVGDDWRFAAIELKEPAKADLPAL